jgi:unsaturated rhamnogalacturonyl hydrolase
MQSEDIKALLERVARGMCRLKAIGAEPVAPAGAGFAVEFQEWDWEVGVGLYGALRYAIANRNTALIASIERWYDGQIARGLPPRQINSTAPMLPLVLLLDHVDRPDLEALTRDWAEWLMAHQPRTEDGGFQHTVKERANDGELWDDTLFMAVLFLGAAGRRFGETAWVDEAAYQFLVHARYLADPPTGLWFHGWTFHGRNNFARARWARGNAWVTVAIPEFIDLVGAVPVAVRRQLERILVSQVNALKGLQRPDGMWTTLLDDPDSPRETSATAGFAYGMLRALAGGLLPPTDLACAERALGAVLERIGEDGIVAEVSDGTAMGHSLDHYRRIPNVPAPYGQALAMLLLSEVQSRMETSR